MTCQNLIRCLAWSKFDWASALIIFDIFMYVHLKILLFVFQRWSLWGLEWHEGKKTMSEFKSIYKNVQDRYFLINAGYKHSEFTQYWKVFINYLVQFINGYCTNDAFSLAVLTLNANEIRWIDFPAVCLCKMFQISDLWNLWVVISLFSLAFDD